MKAYFDRKELGGFFLALGIRTLLGGYSHRSTQFTFTALLIVSGVLIIFLFLTVNTALHACLLEEPLTLASEKIKAPYAKSPPEFLSLDGTETIVKMNRIQLDGIEVYKRVSNR